MSDAWCSRRVTTSPTQLAIVLLPKRYVVRGKRIQAVRVSFADPHGIARGKTYVANMPEALW